MVTVVASGDFSFSAPLYCLNFVPCAFIKNSDNDQERRLSEVNINAVNFFFFFASRT